MKRAYFILSLAALVGLNSCAKKGSSEPPYTPPPTTPTLAITDFSPKSAKPFTNITITGKGFGNDVSSVKVAFGASAYYEPSSVSPTEIVIPTNLATPSGKVTVLVNGEKVISATEFTALLQDVKVAGYPAHGQLRSQIYIVGDGFGKDTDKIAVSFAGTAPVKPNYIGSLGTIGVRVPRYAQSGKITVTVGGQSSTGKDDFNLDMSVRDFSPKTAAIGDTVKFTGVAFTDKDDMKVYFSETTNFVHPIKVTPTELLAVVPSSAVTGYLSVTANSGTIADKIFDGDLKFTLKPTVYFNTQYVPNTNKVGDVIRLWGNFSGADITKIGVSFAGSKPVQPTSINGTDIYVKIPNDAKTGKITVSRQGYKSSTSTDIITIVP